MNNDKYDLFNWLDADCPISWNKCNASPHYYYFRSDEQVNHYDMYPLEYGIFLITRDNITENTRIIRIKRLLTMLAWMSEHKIKAIEYSKKKAFNRLQDYINKLQSTHLNFSPKKIADYQELYSRIYFLLVFHLQGFSIEGRWIKIYNLEDVNNLSIDSLSKKRNHSTTSAILTTNMQMDYTQDLKSLSNYLNNKHPSHDYTKSKDFFIATLICLGITLLAITLACGLLCGLSYIPFSFVLPLIPSCTDLFIGIVFFIIPICLGLIALGGFCCVFDNFVNTLYYFPWNKNTKLADHAQKEVREQLDSIEEDIKKEKVLSTKQNKGSGHLRTTPHRGN